MNHPPPTDTDRALAALTRHGLLLLTDATLPSLSTLVAGEPVTGSWWGHPAGEAIFHAAEALDDHPDVLAGKLLRRKVTFVHRRLWSALVAVAVSDAPWQRRGLSATSAAALEAVQAAGSVRSDALPADQRRALGDLEARLLVHSRQVHTESGRHARLLQTWEIWSADQGADLAAGALPAVAAATATLLAAVQALAGGDAAGLLPWT